MGKVTKHWTMRATCGAALLALAGGPTVAQTPQSAASIWSAFADFCPKALEDPQAFVDALPSQVPAGTFGIVASPDQKLVKLNLARSNYFYTLELVFFGEEINRSCSVTYNGEGTSEAGATASAFEGFLTSSYPEASKIGGLYPEQYAEYTGNDDQIRLNRQNYIYVMNIPSVIADAKFYVQIVDGFMSINATDQVTTK